MKMRNTISLLLLSTAATSFAAVTFGEFDGGPDTPWTPGVFGALPGPQADSGGGVNGSDALKITTDGVNGQGNTVAWDRTIVGGQGRVPFTFAFKLGPGGSPNDSADGFSFALLPTSSFGTTGVANFSALDEDPDFAGTLAFGFDTWGNGAPFDGAFQNGNQSDYTDISLFWNGGLVASMGGAGGLPDPRTIGLTIDDNAYHTASGEFNFANGTVTLMVDNFSIFNAVSVPGLPAAGYEWRLGIGARTGGQDENAWFDNIAVGVPEPATSGFAALGLCFLARRRRK